MSQLPRLALVKQQFNDDEIENMVDVLQSEIRSLKLQYVKPGQTVAVTAGSRGIHRIDLILRTVCDLLKETGAQPFVFPAMGSHGGATAQGQIALLAEKGITEKTVGVPIRSSMEVVCLGQTDEGIPVYVDALAASADHMVVVNRVKAHTKFKGPIESGLFKMMAAGMGNYEGATTVHRYAVRHGFPTVLLSLGRKILRDCSILFGLLIVENGYHRTHTLKALAPEADRWEQEEIKHLVLAKGLLPRLPLNNIDLLIVDRIGKKISGTGMDTNIIGRNRDILGDFTIFPRIKRIFVRDLMEPSDGNALGIGQAEFTTDRLVRAMDYAKTVTNALAAISPERAAIPIHFATDKEAVMAALNSLGVWEPETVGVVRILDTMNLKRLYVSEALLPFLPSSTRLIDAPQPLEFNPEGNLPPFP